MFKKTMISAAVLAVISTSSYATTYYVATTGYDSNPGTQAQPWRTVQKCADTIVGGDTCMVGNGDYTDQTKVHWTRSGASTSSIAHIRSTNQYGAKIRGFDIDGADYVRVSYFDIQDLAASNSCITIGNGAHDDIVTYNRFQFCVNGGIYMTAPPTNPSAVQRINVSSNTFWRVGQYAMVVQGRYNSIANNTISEMIDHHPCDTQYPDYYDNDGIRIFGGGHTVSGNWISVNHGSIPGGETGGTCSVVSLSDTNNDFIGVNAHPDCIMTFSDSTEYEALSNTVIKNNVCHAMAYNPSTQMPAKFFELGGGGSGIDVYNNQADATFIMGVGDTSGVKVQNNTFVSHETMTPFGGLGIQFENSPNSIVRNNVFEHVNGNGNAIVSYDSASQSGAVADYNCYRLASTPQGAHDRQGNINFVNEGSKDYHLQSSSVCVNYGLTISTITTDRDGTTRPQGSAYDIGAYEYH